MSALVLSFQEDKLALMLDSHLVLEKESWWD